MRDCNTCVYARTPDDMYDNGCTAWDCEYINRKEAIEIYKQIVYCKDCKYWEREECRLDPFYERDTEPTDFCSRGEHKGE